MENEAQTLTEAIRYFSDVVPAIRDASAACHSHSEKKHQRGQQAPLALLLLSPFLL